MKKSVKNFRKFTVTIISSEKLILHGGLAFLRTKWQNANLDLLDNAG